MNNDHAHKRFNRFDTLFHKVMNKMRRIEKTPRKFGTDVLLYPSEIHTLDVIGRNTGINITDLAALQGVTKGAVSQVIRKLVDKEMVIRMKDEKSDREVLLMLSGTGKVAFDAHRDFHSQIDPHLIDIINNASEDNIRFMESIFTSLDRFCDEILKKS